MQVYALAWNACVHASQRTLRTQRARGHFGSSCDARAD
ncbi:hypothetical protein XCR_0792 [Xanthomonas campestris pv. raphani 756C]|nr:hypothetical protein XCR_0792 [Xanthomonas campestris pv. raphani 756C]